MISKEGGVVAHQMNEVHVTGLPDDIPENIQVDISELGVNDVLHLSDVTPPKGLEFDKDELEHVLANCSLPHAEKAADTTVTEPEVIGEKKPAEGEAAASADSKGEKETKK